MDIFLSDIRHRERSAFVLCDNLVEMACKRKNQQHCRQTSQQPPLRCDFHDALRLPGFRLSNAFRDSLQQRREIRNLMQHQSSTVAVDLHTCADAIKDLPTLFRKLWGRNSLDNLRDWHRVALRIVNLYSSNGNPAQRQLFEDSMRDGNWRTDLEVRKPRMNENIIQPGRRGHWGLLTKNAPVLVEQVLNSCDIP